MADRHFIPRTCSHALWSVDVGVWLTWEGAFLSRDTRSDEASLWSMPRGRSIFALDYSTNEMNFIYMCVCMCDGLLISMKISRGMKFWLFKYFLFIFFFRCSWDKNVRYRISFDLLLDAVRWMQGCRDSKAVVRFVEFRKI